MQNMYTMHVRNLTDKTNKTETFDYVILATPLPISSIDVSFLPKDIMKLINSVEYQSMCTIIVKGELDPEYFHWEGQLPALIVTTEYDNVPFYSLSRLSTKSEGVYKLFTPECIDQNNMNSTYLGKVFKANSSVIHAQKWLAYPVMKPRDEFPPILLDKGLYYLNAFEPVLSVMEVEALSAMNIARLILKEEKISEKIIEMYEGTLAYPKSGKKEESNRIDPLDEF